MSEFIGTESVFIIGSPRSGTTILAWSLSKHEDFWTSAESDFLYSMFRQNKLYYVWEQSCMIKRNVDPWLKKNKVAFDEFSKFVGTGIDQMFLSRSKGKRWIDSAPSNTNVARQNALLFPNSKFIHILRNGLSVVNSMVKSGFKTQWAAEFEEACIAWVHYVSVSRKMHDEFPDRTLLVKHEDLVDDPKLEFLKIHQFLGVEPSRVSADYMMSNRMNSSFGKKMARPSNPWDNWSIEQKEIFKSIAQETMEYYSYPVPF